MGATLLDTYSFGSTGYNVSWYRSPDGGPWAGSSTASTTKKASNTGTNPTTFADVPSSHPYYQDIEILYANGLTAGCLTSPLKFCPDQIMSRGQAAVFMLRGNFGSSYLPAPATHYFKDDWSKGAWAEPWAEAVHNEGLSAGCLANPLTPVGTPLKEQIEAIATKLYGADGVDYLPQADKDIARMTQLGFGDAPVCMAKTHLSLSHDPLAVNRPTGYRLPVRGVVPSAGAGFVVVLCGDMQRMPGLGRVPNFTGVDIDADGRTVGLF